MYVQKILPDGTPIQMLNLSRFDTTIGALFEDEAIRRENLKIAVQNATDIPGLAERAGRLVEKSGVSVVSLGNIEGENIDACRLTVREEDTKSETVKFLQKYLSCDLSVSEERDRADMTLIVGTSFAKRYQPFRQ
jgi:hypothetical protein